MSPISSLALDALVTAGASAEQVAEFIKKEQAADAERLATEKRELALKREYERKRKRAWRLSRNVPGTSGDIRGHTPSLSSSTSITTSVVGGGMVDADARDQLVSQEAIALADDLYLIFGIDREFVPPGWCGLAMWLQAGLACGWQAPIVRIAANEVAGQLRRRKKQLPYSYKYLREPIVREHENAARPQPPVPEIPDRQLPLMRPVHGQSRPSSRTGGATEAAWRLAEDAANEYREAKLRRDWVEGDRPGGQGVDSDEGRPSPRVVSIR